MEDLLMSAIDMIFADEDSPEVIEDLTTVEQETHGPQKKLIEALKREVQEGSKRVMSTAIEVIKDFGLKKAREAKSKLLIHFSRKKNVKDRYNTAHELSEHYFK